MTREGALNILHNSSVYHPMYLDALKMAIEALEQESTTKNDLGVDWDELKRKIFMEVDGGTDDKWLSYADVCDNISNSIDEFKADLPSVTPQEPILDKIRAEIEQLPTTLIDVQRPHSVVERDVVELGSVIRILDKYKAEVREKE